MGQVRVVLHRRLRPRVTQSRLGDFQGDALLVHHGRVPVPQEMPGDVDPEFLGKRFQVAPQYVVVGDRSRTFSVDEDPLVFTPGLPLFAERPQATHGFLTQVGRLCVRYLGCVEVAFAEGFFHPDAPALPIDVAPPKGCHFTDPQAGDVRQPEKRRVRFREYGSAIERPTATSPRAYVCVTLCVVPATCNTIRSQDALAE